jgi:hypothetical protein
LASIRRKRKEAKNKPQAKGGVYFDDSVESDLSLNGNTDLLLFHHQAMKKETMNEENTQ